MLAEIGETVVLTRSDNKEWIEAGLKDLPLENRPTFEYVPTHPRLTGNSGPRVLLLTYLLWQRECLRRARALQAANPFDLVWHLTYANVWLGSIGPLIGPPFIFGPVGGGVGTFLPLWPSLGVGGVVAEVIRSGAKALSRIVNPLGRSAWSDAHTILVQNKDTKKWLPRARRGRVEIFPHVVLGPHIERSEHDVEHRRPRTAITACRLLPWKGISLALRALTYAPEWQLVVCGDGPDLPRLKRLAAHLGVASRVQFRGWISADEMRNEMETASVVLFPSLHDEAGWVVVEASLAGTPVISLDRGGPPELGASPIRAGGPRSTARRLAEMLGKELTPAAIDAFSYTTCLARARLIAERALSS